MQKLSKPLKLKLIFVLIMSNVSIFMMSSESEQVIEEKINSFQKREGYSEIRISAQMLTRFETNKPISILSNNKQLLIPYALLLDKDFFSVEEEDQFDPITAKQDKYIIYLPNKDIPKILDKKKLVILPYGKNYKFKQQRVFKGKRSYEISI